MSIIRGPRPNRNFYILDKKISEDKRLSWASRGLLIYLLGKPNHWQVSVQALVNETKASTRPTGRDATWSLLRELIEAGYCTRHQSRKPDGTVGEMEYTISEDCANHPLTAYPCTDEPCTANPTLVSIDSKKGLNEKQGLNITAAPLAPPTVSAKPTKGAKLVTAEESALQEACRTTWSAYSSAYEVRYGAAPLRNVQASSKLKQFVLRIGHQDSPDVARFFVERISDPFVLRSYHGVGLLLQNAEAYHTQWVTNKTHVEPTTAYQARQDSRANFFKTVTTQGRKNANLHTFDDSNTVECESQFIGAYPDGEADPMGCPGF